MTSFGRQLLSQTGVGIQVTADGNPIWKAVGGTIDWSTVAAVNSDTVVTPEGVTILNGRKYLPHGQILVPVGSDSIDTIAIAGTGGTYTLSVAVNGGTVQTTGALAFDASAATIQAALQGLSNVEVGNALVTGASTPFSVDFAGALKKQLVTLTINPGSLTGGSGTVTATATGSLTPGKVGPYDPAAIDGRALIVRGYAWILNELVIEKGLLSLGTAQATDHPGMIEGGLLWRDRILMSQTGSGVAHSLAAGPTEAEFLAAFPLVRYAQ